MCKDSPDPALCVPLGLRIRKDSPDPALCVPLGLRIRKDSPDPALCVPWYRILRTNRTCVGNPGQVCNSMMRSRPDPLRILPGGSRLAGSLKHLSTKQEEKGP